MLVGGGGFWYVRGAPGTGIPGGTGMDEGVNMSRGEYSTRWTWDLGYPPPRRDLGPGIPIRPHPEVTLVITKYRVS